MKVNSSMFNRTKAVKGHEHNVINQDDNNNINHPQHYTQGIECWDYIVSHGMNYLEGNIVKYVTRYKLKNGLEDLKKAQHYLNKLIEVVENEKH